MQHSLLQEAAKQGQGCAALPAAGGGRKVCLHRFFNAKSASFYFGGRNVALIFRRRFLLFFSKITEAVFELVSDLPKKTKTEKRLKKIEKTVERKKIK